MNADALEMQLRQEGFNEVYVWRNSAGDLYPLHIHEDVTAHVVLQGSLILTVHGVDHEYREGERFDIPAHQEHSARFGPEGCTYIIGEKV
jgi:quercetin dioxygenase-like cupin family protein